MTQRTHSKSLLIALGLLCVLLSAWPGKRIWYDEFLHFAVGAYESTDQAWQVVRSSVGRINHGQTGAYIMADYWLLRIFGASSFWLRFPSLLAGILLFISALHLFEQWKLPVRWRVWGCLALFTQPSLMPFVSVARPYMTLAATTVGTLAYYSTPLNERSRLTIRLLGITSIVGGALFHPYFPVYWLFVCCFAYFHRVAQKQEAPEWDAFLRHCNPLLSAFGVIAYFTLGYLTWMPHRIRFINFDPFKWIGTGVSAVQTFVSAHIGFLWWLKSPFLAVIAFTGAGVFFISSFRQKKRDLLSPVFLLAFSFAISVFLSYLSYRVNYWIVPRQWIASIALITLASTWFAYLFSTLLDRKLAMIWSLLLFGLVGWNSVVLARKNITEFYAVLSRPVAAVGLGRPPFNPRPTNKDEWIALANLNCARGGPVWPVFQRFYGEHQ